MFGSPHDPGPGSGVDAGSAQPASVDAPLSVWLAASCVARLRRAGVCLHAYRSGLHKWMQVRLFGRLHPAFDLVTLVARW